MTDKEKLFDMVRVILEEALEIPKTDDSSYENGFLDASLFFANEMKEKIESFNPS